MSNICHIKTAEDEVISQHIQKSGTPGFAAWNADIVSAKIQFYNAEHPNDILDSDENAEEVAQKLISWETAKRVERSNQQHPKHGMFQYIVKAYKQLKVMNPTDRIDSVDTVVYLFSKYMDEISERFDITREEAANGYRLRSGKMKFGENYIFEQILTDIQIKVNQLSNIQNPTTEQDSLLIGYKMMLTHWNAIVLVAKSKLALTEGLNLGRFFNYAQLADALDEGTLSLDEESEEGVKDPVDRIKDDQIASINKISQITRNILSKIPVYETYIEDNGIERYVLDAKGQPVPTYNQFGIPKYRNASVMHNKLCNVLQGCNTKKDVYLALKKITEGDNKIWEFIDLRKALTIPDVFYTDWQSTDSELFSEEQLEHYLKADKMLQALLLDYNKVMQPYAKIGHPSKGRRYKKEFIINDVTNIVRVKYEQQLTTNDANALSLYNKEGNINRVIANRFIEALEFFKKYNFSKSEINKADKESNKGKSTFAKQSRNFYYKALDNLAIIVNALNIPYADRGTLAKIWSNSKEMSKILNLIKQVDYEVTSYYKDILTPSAAYGSVKIETVPYEKLYEHKSKEASASDTPKIQRLANALCDSVGLYSAKAEIVLENRARTKNSKGKNVTMFSYINPGYMTQFFKDIKKYILEEDITGLRNFLDKKFGQNPAFIDEQRIKDNPDTTYKFRINWLNYLYNLNSREFEDPWSYANNIGTIRVLGAYDDNKPFENFSPKEHWESFFSSYFRLVRNSNGISTTADYPVFISGDANQFKTINAPIYGVSDIVEGLIKVFYMERALQTQFDDPQNGIKARMIDDGYKPVNTPYGEKTGKYFCLFPDFNEIFEGIEDIGELSEKDIRKLIEEYVSTEGSAFKSFKQSCIKYGVITESDNKYQGSYEFQDVLKKTWSNEKLDLELQKMWLNEKYAMVQQMALMTVSPMFYVNLADLQKRYKETHSSGQKLDTDALDRNGIKVFGDNPIQRTIYLTEVRLNGEDIDPKFMKVVKAENPSVYDKYTKIDGTDGQAFRTLHSYRKVMLGLGKWTDKMEDFYQDYLQIKARHTDGSDFTDEEFKALSKYDIVMQPLKPFLFTHELYGSDAIPVQIKCSEAVLIPEFLKKGSRIRHLAEYLENNNIDVATMTSAIKVGAWGDVDIMHNPDGISIKNKEDLFKSLQKAKVHELSYKDYLLQVNVPPHEYQKRLFATQIRKLILGGEYDPVVTYFGKNVPLLHREDGSLAKPKQMNKYSIRQFYNELIVANFIDSVKEYLSDLESPDKIADLLIRSMIANDDVTFDSLLGLIIEERNGRKYFTLPLCEGVQEYKIVEDLIAIFKKTVNKQQIMGGSGVQVSSVGIEGYDESDNLHYVTEGNNIIYAEVEIPLMHKWKDADGKEHTIDYDKYCNNDCTLKTDSEGNFLIDKDFPGIRDFVAYRIPTERAYSMINCKAVRFSRPSTGITIKVPSQGVTIAGFDFDIDKLYFMFKAFEENEKYVAPDAKHLAESKLISAIFNLDRWKDYNWDKSVENNSRVARDNMLVEIIRQRLMDKNTLKERTTPGGFPTAENVAYDMIFMNLEDVKKSLKGRTDLTADVIREERLKYQKEKKLRADDLEQDYNYTDLETLVMLNQRNQIAAKLIGIFANQNVNHVYCTGMSRLSLLDPIAFGQHIAEGLYNLLEAPEGVDTFGTLAEFLAASVDAVKKPVLGYMNLTSITANVACLLARLGYELSDISYFLNQPIIKYVCDKAQEIGSSVQSVINDVFSKANQNINDVDEVNPSTSEMLYNILNTEADITDNTQLGILKLFSRMLDDAAELNLVVTKTKFTAANAINPTFGNYYSLIDDIDKFNDLQYLAINSFGLQKEPISNKYNLDVNDISTYLGKLSSNPMAFEQGMFDCLKLAISKMLQYFPYETRTYQDTRSVFKELSITGHLDEDTINLMHKDLSVFLLASKPNSIFNRETKYSEDLTYGQYILEKFPLELKEFMLKHPEIKQLKLFNYLNIETTPNKITGKNTTTIRLHYSTIVDSKTEKDSITDSWEELLNFGKKGREIATNLFLYNFYKTGFGYGPSSFIQYTPTAVREKLGLYNSDILTGDYSSFWYDLVNNPTLTQLTPDQIMEFIKMWIVNHLENRNFVKVVTGNTAEEIEPLFKDAKGNFVDSKVLISIDESDFKTSGSLANLSTVADADTNALRFAPCLRFYDKKEHEYVYFLQTNLSTDANSSAVYQRVEPVGSTNSYLQYAAHLESLIPLEQLSDIVEEDPVTEPGENGEPSPANSENFTPEDDLNPYPIYDTKKPLPKENSLDNLFIKLVDDVFNSPETQFLAFAIKTKYRQDKSAGLETLLKAVADETDTKILQLKNAIIEKAKKEGIMVLNSEGKEQISC